MDSEASQSSSSVREVERHAREVLERYLSKDVLVMPSERDAEAERQASAGARTIVVEFKRLSTVRLEDLQGRLALATLQLRKQTAETTSIPLALLSVPSLSPRAYGAAQAFMRLYAPDVAWGIVADDGSVMLDIPQLKLEVKERAQKFGVNDRPLRGFQRQYDVNLFSDLNRWMLKILLLKDVDPKWWGGPRVVARNFSQLGEIAGASLGAAHRLVQRLEFEDFLRRTSEGLQLVRHDALLRAWFSQQLLERAARTPVRWDYGQPGGTKEVFDQKKATLRYAVGGFEACRLLGVLHAVSPGREVHIDRPAEEILSALDLQQCEPRDAHFTLVRTRYPESIFRGMVKTDESPVVDILQAALDTSVHPARGQEQAEYIMGEILGWRHHV